MSSEVKAALVEFIQSGASPNEVALASFKHVFKDSKLTVWTLLKISWFENLFMCNSILYFSQPCTMKA